MSEPRGASPARPGPPAGLCALCRHVREIVSAKGSTFYLCRRAEVDPRFRKYPPLPVVSCVGYERREPEVTGS